LNMVFRNSTIVLVVCKSLKKKLQLFLQVEVLLRSFSFHFLSWCWRNLFLLVLIFRC
jgi:hypothetical protein